MDGATAKEIARTLVDYHQKVGGATISLETGTLVPPPTLELGFLNLTPNPRRRSGKRFTTREVRSFLWEHRKAGGGANAIWIVYDPNMDSSFLGLARVGESNHG